MRLISAKHELTIIFTELKFILESWRTIQLKNGVYVIDNGDMIFKISEQIRAFPAISDMASQILASSPNLPTGKKQITLDSSSYNSLVASVQTTIEKIILIQKFISDYTIEDRNDQVNVELPENFSFSDLENFIDIFKNPSFKRLNDNKSAVLYGVDNGCSILLIGCLTIKGIKILLGFAKEALEISIKWNKLLILREEYKKAKITTDLLIEADNRLREVWTADAIEKYKSVIFDAQINPKDDPEVLSQLRFMLNQLIELFEKGVEIHPSMKLDEVNEKLEEFPKKAEYKELVDQINKLKLLSAPQKEEIKDTTINTEKKKTNTPKKTPKTKQ